MLELCHGAPAEKRAENEQAVYDFLDKCAIPFSRVDHPPVHTMEDCLAADAILNVEMCKNLFLCNSQKTSFYLLTMPEDKPFHTKDLSHQIGSARLSFASPEAMVELLGCTPGSASVLGLMNDTENHVQLIMDKPVVESSLLGCHPCVNTSSLRMKTKDVMEKFLPAVHHEAIIVDLPEYAE